MGESDQMDGMEEENYLTVQMFGKFLASYQGKQIVGGTKSGETQFTSMMQLLWHHGREGVSRSVLEQILFEDREITDLRHAMRSVVYNAKKKLKAAGLPDVNYISQKEGVYYWTDEISVREDAADMEAFYQAAQAEQDPKERLELYLKACYCYTGEFLENKASVIWVAQEARKYRGIFCACTEAAAELMRSSQDFFRMEKLGIYAAKVNPLADWETITMEALISLGRDEDARKFYDDTVEMYFQEVGLRPTGRLMELLNKLGGQIGHHYAVLDDIQEKLTEEDENASGSYFCSYPIFQGIYRMVVRLTERGGQSVYLMLCTVVDGKGNPMKDGPVLDELSERLGEAIQKAARRGDAVNKYGKGQYLVLLINTTRENCRILQQRINYHFIVGRQRTGVQYYVNSVVCTPDHERIV